MSDVIRLPRGPDVILRGLEAGLEEEAVNGDVEAFRSMLFGLCRSYHDMHDKPHVQALFKERLAVVQRVHARLIPTDSEPTGSER